jgi:S-DNA-T family DNA segregation ATPase FtsK/SpoIIIE
MTCQQQLNHQANQIEMVLASYQLPGRISGGLVTPLMTRFQFIPQLGTRLNRLIGMSEELALSLGVPTCHIHREDGAIHIDIPQGNNMPIHLLQLCRQLPSIPPCSPVLGLDQEGFPLLLSLTSADIAHVLIAGTTGSGKTALARAMIMSLALHNNQGQLQLALIDLKHRGFAPFCALPHLLSPVAERAEEALALLDRLVAEMERRDKLGISQPQIVLFIDELAELVMAGKEQVEAALTRLMQRGREAGLHIVACTQKPLSSLIGSLVKANFPVRIVGKVASAEDAKVASGIAASGAEKLAGHGDFLVIAAGRQFRMQAAWISEAEIAQLVRPLQDGKRGRQLLADTDEPPARRGIRALLRGPRA